MNRPWAVGADGSRILDRPAASIVNGPIQFRDTNMKSHALTRRQFVTRSALAAGALAFPFVARRNVLGANNRLNIAGIGVGGKGASDLENVNNENIYALCDVDEVNGAGTFQKYPQAKRFKDFRVMLEKEGKNIDAVTVSTPDHMHAPAALMAMKLGKHVYCQKPLTHTVFEARQMAEVARQHKVATQMGNQGHCSPDTRRLVELIQAGALGRVSAIHVWTDRPGTWWPQGIERPKGTPPVPPTLDYRRARRHGLSLHGLGLLFAQARRARQRRGAVVGCERRNRAKLVDHYL